LSEIEIQFERNRDTCTELAEIPVLSVVEIPVLSVVEIRFVEKRSFFSTNVKKKKKDKVL
jgi:hypothetical protein